MAMSDYGALSFFPADRARDLDPLSMEERGMYMTIMRHEWPNGGPIPLDEAEVLLGQKWSSTTEMFRRRFVEKKGAIALQWIEDERTKRNSFLAKQRINGGKGGRPKSKNTKELGENPSLTQAYPKPNPSPNPNETQRGRVGKGRKRGVLDEVGNTTIMEYPAFDDFWSLYEGRGSKKEALAAWNKLSKADREAAFNGVTAYFASRTDPKYRRHAQRYLDLRVWEDDVRPDTTAGSGAVTEKYRAIYAELLGADHGPDVRGHANGSTSWRREPTRGDQGLLHGPPGEPSGDEQHGGDSHGRPDEGHEV